MTKPRRVAVMLDLDWPYKRHAGIFVGTQQYAKKHGWESIIDEYADDTLSSLPAKATRYDGIIARATGKLAQRATSLKVPLVNVWFGSPLQRKLPGVFPDFRSIGCLRAEHLLAQGFRRFAGLTSEEPAQVLEMEAFSRTVNNAGYACSMGKMPLAPSSSLSQWRKAERAIATSMADWKPPIGVFAGREQWGRLLVQMCRGRGWRVPEDVAIIAGDNEETFCERPHPTLTSVELGYERIGYEAARLLDRLMGGKAPPAEAILMPPHGLVVRESTDFFAADDPLIAAALEFITAKSHLEIGPDDVAAAVNAETRTLQRRFRKYLDRPIATKIRQVRIERAKRQLTQGKQGMKEIARDVGFGEAMRMYDVFRRELGVTPSKYRRQRQAAETTGEAR
jgi:LacI family transcriptional regulator